MTEFSRYFGWKGTELNSEIKTNGPHKELPLEGYYNDFKPLTSCTRKYYFFHVVPPKGLPEMAYEGKSGFYHFMTVHGEKANFFPTASFLLVSRVIRQLRNWTTISNLC